MRLSLRGVRNENRVMLLSEYRLDWCTMESLGRSDNVPGLNARSSTSGPPSAQRAKRGAMEATSSSPIAKLKSRSHRARFRSRPIPTPKRVQSEAQG